MPNNMKNKANEQIISSLKLVRHAIDVGYLGPKSNDRQPCMDVIDEAIRRITYMYIKGIEAETIATRC